MKFTYKKYKLVLLNLIFIIFSCSAQQKVASDPTTYLENVKEKLVQTWPNNKTINIVFHGHSVPTGYFRTPNVNTLDAYPHLTLVNIKQNFPFAVVNVITTSIGGEQAEQGAKRFASEVLCHRPDVLFIDYALNDRRLGLQKAKVAWEQMIEEALNYGTKVILLTPTPDTKEDITSEDSELAKHSQQIRALAKKYKVGLVDSYAKFKAIAQKESLSSYMAQNNHINQKGHQIVADAIFEYFTHNQN